MNTADIQNSNLISNIELNGFREKTDQLMVDLQNNDIDSALECINEINEINGKSFYTVIGKLTRGLHDAISDLSISSNQDQSENNKTRVDLSYVIRLTDDAAQKTLDMTEQAMLNINHLTQSNSEQNQLIESYLSNNSPDEETTKLLHSLSSLSQDKESNLSKTNKNITEIIMAQNFQDITSQSITKAMNIVKEVENSLVALTQYANLLAKLSQFSDQNDGQWLAEDSEALKSTIGQVNNIKENEHLDQGDVDDLLSSLGF